jgi:4-alpha-glucanotransferase
MSADSWGVAFGFHDGKGDWQPAAEETRAAVRRSLGAPLDAGDSDTGPVSDGALVVAHGSAVELSAPTTLRTEDGAFVRIAANSQVPGDLPAGYHSLFDESTAMTRALIVTPPSCTPFEKTKQWGWATQMYALRSRSSWGIGEFRDLRTLNEWSHKHGASMALINPLHAAAPVLSQQPSPYFPTSRCFRNPLALTIEEVPGFADVASQLDPIATEAQALNSNRRIDRDAVFTAKYRALTSLWQNWNSRSGTSQHRRFDEYKRSEGDTLTNFATFSALAEIERSSWMDWPIDLQTPTSPGVTAFRDANRDRIEFHMWVQWLVADQLSKCSGGLDLMTDLAIGVDRGGADAWIWQDSFALDMSVGAPPDSFNTQGQNWGLPPFDPWRLRRNGYEAFIRTVRSAFQHAQALRMDHVMGLFRLYWIPDGQPATNGCYVYLPFQDLLGIIAIESQRAGAYVVGEDLGTVEPYVREELSNHRILSYRLRQFEGGPSQEFPEQALAALTTHDLPTIPGFWTRSDVETQTAMGLQPNVEGTENIRSQLAEWSGVASDSGPEAVHEVVVGAYRNLAEAPSVILTATLDDALGVVERPNMPGTIDEWPNWRIALPMPLEDILADPRVAEVAAVLHRV